MSPEKQRRTFLSYSRVNKDFALKLARELKADGFLVWLDQLDIPTGSRWDDELEKALEESEIFMVILTPASTASDNVKDEIGYAIDNGKRILPILLKDAKVPLRLRRFQYVDFTTKDFEDGIASAKQLLRNLIEEQTIPREKIPVGSQDKESQAKAQESKDKVEEQLMGDKEEAERIAKLKANSERSETERRNVMKASSLLSEGKQLLQNQDWPGAVQIFQQVLTLTPNHAETKKLLSDTEAKILQERDSKERKAKEDSEKLAELKAEGERLASEKKEAERLATQKAEDERKAREEVERVARLKAEEEKLAKEKQELEKIHLQAQAQAPEPDPIAQKPETMSAPPKKKLLSKPLKIGIGVGVSLVLVVCAVLGVGMVFGPTDPPISDPPVVVDPPVDDPPVVADPPTAVIPITGDDPACPWDDSQYVDVNIENLSSFALDYFWIDYDCEPQYYGTLNPGETITLGTYISHVWEFYDNQTGDYYFGYETDGGDYLTIPGNNPASWSNPFEESFDDNSNGWYTGSDNTGSKSVDDGYYVWDVHLTGGGSDAWQFLNTDISVSDFNLRVDAKRLSGTPGDLCYGLVFRSTMKDLYGIVSEQGEYYELEVCDDQYYLITHYDGNDWDYWLDWPQYSGINTNDWNTLEVRATGNQLEYFINNTKVAEFSDSNLDSGNVGLSVYSYDDTQGQIIFDNFYLDIK